MFSLETEVHVFQEFSSQSPVILRLDIYKINVRAYRTLLKRRDTCVPSIKEWRKSISNCCSDRKQDV